MQGVQYKDTFAGKGSDLYAAITEGRDADAKRLYAETGARYHATVHGMAVPVVIYELDKLGNRNGKWRIESSDACYDNNGRFKEKK